MVKSLTQLVFLADANIRNAILAKGVPNDEAALSHLVSHAPKKALMRLLEKIGVAVEVLNFMGGPTEPLQLLRGRRKSQPKREKERMTMHMVLLCS